MAKKKDRIPTEGPQQGLNSAFAGLEITGLPKGPDAPPPPAPSAPAAPKDIWKMGRVVLRKETSGRSGKSVIVVYDFATHLPVSVIETIAKKLRTACGCGGTVKGRLIEIQGDQPAKIRQLLEEEGFQVAGIR